MNLSAASPFLGPLAIIALLIVPVRWHVELHGWRLRSWIAVTVGATIAVLIPLLPDVDAARPLIASVATALGLPLGTILTLGVMERWRWRWMIPLGLAVAVCVAVPILLLPAHAADGLASTTTAPVSPLLPPELVGVPIPSWLTTLLAGAALARYVGGLLKGGIDVRFNLHHTTDDSIRKVEIHLPPKRDPIPEPDPSLTEPSGVRKAPRR